MATKKRDETRAQKELRESGEELQGTRLTSDKMHVVHHEDPRMTACGRTGVGKVCVVAPEELEDDNGCAQCRAKCESNAVAYEAARMKNGIERARVTRPSALSALSEDDERPDLIRD